MRKPIDKRRALSRAARIAAVLACALGAFYLAGCGPAQKLNAELKRELNAATDRLLAGDDLTTDQRLVARAQVEMRGGNYYDAESLLDSAIQINPANNAARLDLAAVYEATHRQERAALLYRELMQPVPVAPTTLGGDGGLSGADAAEIARARFAALEARRKGPIVREPRLQAADTEIAPPAQHAAAPPPVPKGPTAPRLADAAPQEKPAATAAAAKQDDKAKPAKPVHVTLSTHPSETAAREGWQTLAKKHGAVLAGHAPLVLPIERQGGVGVAYRLATGPFASAREAAAFCDKLLARHAYCAISG
ncbi:MAG: hypothetical protein AB7P52_04810 [Alphaproteobacteria bacterium]